MVNYKLVMTGNASFAISYFSCLMSVYIFPTMMEGINNAFSAYNLSEASNFQGIGWIGIIIIWTLAMVVAPIGITIMGLLDEDNKNKDSTGTIFEMIKGFLWGFMALLITYFLFRNNWPTTLANMITNNASLTGDVTIMVILYWTSIISMILLNIIIIPAFIINKARGA